MSDSKVTYEQLVEENQQLRRRVDALDRKKQKKKRFSWWLFRVSSTPFVGKRLKKSIAAAIEEYKQDRRLSVDTVSDVSSNVIWRFTRVGIVALIIALTPSFILIFQTWLLTNQNRLIKNQNIRMDQQTHLIEADRRSSLVFVLGEILSDLGDELKYKDDSKRNISATLKGRIVSLCMAMKPYRYLDKDSMIEKPISPERGQLLLSLLESDVTKTSMQEILTSANLEYADLKDAFLPEGYFKYGRLSYSNFDNAHLEQSNFALAELQFSSFRKAVIKGVDARNTKFPYADLSYVEAMESDFRKSDFSYAKLTGADLRDTDLRQAKFKGADLTGVRLGNALISSEKWFEELEAQNVKGIDDLEDEYSIIKGKGKKDTYQLIRRQS